MDTLIQQRLVDACRTHSGGMRHAPATDEQLAAFEREHGPIPADFRWYLSACGGGGVGAEYVDGIRELHRSHKKFKAEFGPLRGWTMSDVFIIGWDGSGNPFGIHGPTGRILVEDHDFGGIHEMAPSLEPFLIDGLLLGPERALPHVGSERELPGLEDCEVVGGRHEWFNMDNVSSGCYRCRVVRAGQLWP